MASLFGGSARDRRTAFEASDLHGARRGPGEGYVQHVEDLAGLLSVLVVLNGLDHLGHAAAMQALVDVGLVRAT